MSLYCEATVERGRILWMASLAPRDGYKWMWDSPTRYGFTKKQALKRIRRVARRMNVQKNLTERVELDV